MKGNRKGLEFDLSSLREPLFAIYPLQGSCVLNERCPHSRSNDLKLVIRNWEVSKQCCRYFCFLKKSVFVGFCFICWVFFVVYLLYGRKYRTPSVSDTVWNNCCEYLLWAPSPFELAHV